MGRPKKYTERLVLALAKGTTGRMDAALGLRETRLNLIRNAIERELARRSAEVDSEKAGKVIDQPSEKKLQ